MMTFSGTIKLIHDGFIIDKKIYCSREDREIIIDFWKISHKHYYRYCLQIIPSLSQIESRNLMAKFDRITHLENLQRESKERRGLIKNEKKIDVNKLKKFSEELTVKFVRPPAIYDNQKSLYEK
jgi:hypothetical protein